MLLQGVIVNNKPLFKIVLTWVMFSIGLTSYGMMVKYTSSIGQQLLEAQEAQDYNKNVKLLEHSCFKGESLLFQSQFFSSNYKDLPERYKAPIEEILKNNEEAVGQAEKEMFAYHSRYRKKNVELLRNTREYIINIHRAYRINAAKLATENKRPGRQLKDITAPYCSVFNDMCQSFRENDYQSVAWKSHNEFVPLAKDDHYVQYMLNKATTST